MPTVPALKKSWTFSVNNTYSSSGTMATDYKSAMLRVKNILVSFGWSVRYSCDGVTAGAPGDTVDRWALFSNLTFMPAGSAHSWIVLRRATIGPTFDLLISCEPAANYGGNERYATVYVSLTGFSGGTTTARPTAVDEIQLRGGSNAEGWFTGGNWLREGNGPIAWSIHGMTSVDGECTRLILCSYNYACAYWCFEKFGAPVTGHDSPAFIAGVLGMKYEPNPYLDYAHWNDNANCRGRHAGQTYNVYLAGAPFYYQANIGERFTGTPNSFTGSWHLSPISVVSDTPGRRGVHGNVYDLWWGCASFPEGTGYPADGSRRFMQFGDLVFPWGSNAQPDIPG